MKAFTVHRVPHFADAVDREILRMHTLYLWDKQAIADKKVEQILSRYQLNFPEGQDLNTMVSGHPKLINKLQNLELGTKTQEELVDYGEEMGLDLMTTDDGAIIIMDSRDIETFVGGHQIQPHLFAVVNQLFLSLGAEF